MSRIALYPGSFDPITNGHVNIIERGLNQFDEVIVAVLRNEQKKPLFTADERIEMIRESFPHHPNLRVDQFDGLLVNYAKAVGASSILRGIRAVADFEYEYQMANMNRLLDPSIDTVFLMSSPDNFYVSSRLCREVARLDGDISGAVPAHVAVRLTEKFAQLTRS